MLHLCVAIFSLFLKRALMYEGKKRGAVDVVFLSPPWGGTEYCKQATYDLCTMQPAFHQILLAALEISPNIILYLPRNIDIFQLQCLLMGMPGIFHKRGEAVATVVNLLYSKKNIKSVLVLIGPMFYVYLLQRTTPLFS